MYSVRFCAIILTILLHRQTFPSVLSLRKLHLYIKREKTLKENYRPVRILPNLLKIYEKVMFTQMTYFSETIFSRYQSGFPRGFSTQQCLLAILEKWKRCIGKDKTFGTLLTGWSKTSHCLDHKLLIAKPNACGFKLPSLKLIQSYMSNRT